LALICGEDCQWGERHGRDHGLGCLDLQPGEEDVPNHVPAGLGDETQHRIFARAQVRDEIDFELGVKCSAMDSRDWFAVRQVFLL
jgi:hypothetical protein